MMTDELIKQVKRKLNITWDEESTNEHVNDIIQSAIPTLIHKLGITDPEYDFSVAGAENTLFKAYCLYEWNHVTNEFDDNYSQLISEVKRKHTVAEYEASGELTDE